MELLLVPGHGGREDTPAPAPHVKRGPRPVAGGDVTVSVEYKLSRPNERRPIPFFWLLLAQSIACRAMATPPPPRHSRPSPRPRSRLRCKHGPSEPPWCTAPPEWIDRRPACTCAELLLHDVIRACAPPGVMALSAMVEHRPPRHGRHCIVRYQVDREQFYDACWRDARPEESPMGAPFSCA